MAPNNIGPASAWTIIIPVKDTTLAKTRLSGLSQPARAALAQAFVLDAATAALACGYVSEVLAVTNDRAAAESLRETGVRVVRDIGDAGLNSALELGASTVRRENPDVPVAAMTGDLPALRSVDLEAAFEAGLPYSRWFVADADGTGTTLLAASTGSPLAPSFGVRSRVAHSRSGAVDLVGPELSRLRRDVDTEEHLWDAVRLGVGQHTRAALTDLALVAAPRA